jgi:hypothetical protein
MTKNCGALSAVANPPALAVGCSGLFADGAQQVEASGVAWFDLTQATPMATVVGAQRMGRPVSNLDIIALGPKQGFTVTFGEFKGPPADQLWSVDFSASTSKMVSESSASFTLGGLAYAPATKRLYVSDANEKSPKLHIYDVADATAPRLILSVDTSSSGLPPRAAAFY